MSTDPKLVHTSASEILGQLRSVDPHADQPLHVQIRRSLRELIDDYFEDGQKFFTEPELMARLGASRGTIRRALADLARDGLLDRHMAKGSFVRKRVAAVSARIVRVFVPDWDSAYLAGMLQGLSTACRERHHVMHVYNTHRDVKIADICSAVEGRPEQEGVILLQNPTQMTRELYSALTDKGCCPVNIGTLIEDYRGPSINIANEAVVRLSIDHLAGLGHRRIVFLVNEPEASGNVIERCRAFNSIVAERELSDARLVSCGTRFWEDSYAKAYETMPAVLATNPRPTAIFTHSDAGAWAALRWLAEHDIKCPGQISVLGFSDDAPSRFTYPKLTTFAQPTLEMTARAVEMLTERPLPRRIERFLPVLVERESTGPAITE